MANTAVGSERISKTVGYAIKKGDFRLDSPNLPQRIAIIGEANTANQAALAAVFDIGKIAETRKKVSDDYGYGSPIWNIYRILNPLSGGGVGGIPIVVFPQAETGVAKAITITPVGTATKNGTHILKVSGRGAVDGDRYDIPIVTGDTIAAVSTKISDVINAVLGAPVTAAATATEATATAKWTGLTSQEIDIEVDLNGFDDIGITYVVAESIAGSGTPAITTALTNFGNEWNTIVINSYGTEAGTLTALEAFNGIPDPDNPTGRYVGIVFKPFHALTGSVADDPSSITDTRKEDVTIVICPTPLSKGFTHEGAANFCLLHARNAQDTPHLDISGRSLPDMPTPDDIGSMAVYDNRDLIVQKGCSTVNLVSGRYEVFDFVTTYHPDGETPPQFRYVRDMTIDFNVRYRILLIEVANVLDHVIARDNDTVDAEKVVKPKTLISLLDELALNMVKQALIVDAEFSQNGITVEIDSQNPNRLNNKMPYKRSGLVRISATTVTAGFNFSNE